MKTFKFIAPMITLGLLTLGCSEDTNDQDGIPNLAQLQADIEEITDNVTATGDWSITNFVDSGQNETADFAGYGFSFNSDGSLVADNGTTTVSGTWSLTIDDDSSDDSNDDSGSGTDSEDDCDSCTVDQLTDVLGSCSDWFVEKLELNDQDLDSQYSGYDFNFVADGTVSVTNGGDSFSGTWEASGSGNAIQVVLDIPGLDDIPGTWTLHEIELYNGETNVDLRTGDDRLRFRNSCTLGQFTSGGTSTGEIDFNIFFSAPPDFAELTEDWNIISYSSQKIELIHESGGNGGTDLLTFEKN